MFGIQPWHIIVIVIVALVIFGPGRLPGLGRSIGKFLREFRVGTREMTDGIRDSMSKADEAEAAPPEREPRAGSGLDAAPPSGEGSCGSCGAPVRAEARFCGACGFKLKD